MEITIKYDENGVSIFNGRAPDASGRGFARRVPAQRPAVNSAAGAQGIAAAAASGQSAEKRLGPSFPRQQRAEGLQRGFAGIRPQAIGGDAPRLPVGGGAPRRPANTRANGGAPIFVFSFGPVFVNAPGSDNDIGGDAPQIKTG